jgi:transglutaminase-like putative cysteine protease
MKNRTAKYLTAWVLALIFILSSVLTVFAADTGVVKNEKAVIDYTDTNTTGTVKINILAKTDKRIKVVVKKLDEPKKDTTYNYDLNSDAKIESFPLQWGNGEYSVRVMIQAAEPTKYSTGLATTFKLDIKKENENAPFMYANQLVNFNKDSKVVIKAAELTKNAKTELEIVEAIYTFIIENIDYDTKKAETVQAGYVPFVDGIVDAKKGICFDYAAVFAAMLRSQGIPAKLVMGYVKNPDPKAKDPVYHAWNEFYLKDKGGWFKINEMKFDGKKFERVDTTFDAAGKGKSKSAMQFIGDGSNYQKSQEF